MKAADLRQRYIDFFVKKHDHTEILGASLLPENDPTVLFTTAGMHPLVPYLMGEKHPAGTRLVDAQLCVRTGDIDEVGDDTHLTLFEMMGNWSLGDYFKKESIEMSYEFLSSSLEDGGLGLDADRLAVSVFEGDDDAGLDEDSIAAWQNLGFVLESEASVDQKKRIYTYPKKENWWGPAGLTGPCGPDSEIFYYNSDNLEEMWNSQPSDDVTPWVEIWNNVFMQYNKDEDGNFEPLSQQNVDTGLGLERVTCILQGKASPYYTDIFLPVLTRIRSLAVESNQEYERIIADHIRAATFIIGDERGVTPSNSDQGYVVRRLLRRAIRFGRKLGINGHFTAQLARLYIGEYGEFYKSLIKNEKRILEALEKEEEQFQKTLANGEQEIEKDLIGVSNAIESLEGECKVFEAEMALNEVMYLLRTAFYLFVWNVGKTLFHLIHKTLNIRVRLFTAHFFYPANGKLPF